MFVPVAIDERRERLWKLGSAVRARIYLELKKQCSGEDDAVDAISYPGPQESVFGHSGDDD